MLLKRIIAITTGLVLGLSSLCYADNIELLKQELNNCNEQINQINDEMQELDCQIESTIYEQKRIENSIAQEQEYLNNLKKSMNDLSELRDSRVRRLYKEGNSQLTYLKVIFQSKGILEAFNNSYQFRQLIDNDNRILDDYSQTFDTYQEELVNLENLEKDNNDLLSDLTSKKEEQNKLLNEYNSKVSSVNLKINIEQTGQIDQLVKDSESISNPSELQIIVNSLNGIRPSLMNQELQSYLDNAVNKLNQRISNLTVQQTAQSAVNRGFVAGLVPPETQNRIITEAYKYLGIPYLWGGTDPRTGLDCSGFVQLVYHNLGYNISRTTYTQIYDGIEVEVSLDKLQAGDLIFFGDKSAPHHVALYIGDNKYIHAPQTGDVVKVSEGALRACCARRIIQ